MSPDIEELLSVAPRRLPRRVVQLIGGSLVAVALTGGAVRSARPQVQTGHGSIAASTAERYHAEHQVSGTPVGNTVRGFFLL